MSLFLKQLEHSGKRALVAYVVHTRVLVKLELVALLVDRIVCEVHALLTHITRRDAEHTRNTSSPYSSKE